MRGEGRRRGWTEEERRKGTTRLIKTEERAAEEGSPWKEGRALYTNLVSELPFRATPDTPPQAAAMLITPASSLDTHKHTNRHPLALEERARGLRPERASAL